MEDVVPNETLESDSDKDDNNLIYNRDQFKVDKARGRYESCGIIVKRGVDVADLDARTSRVRAVLEAQGWVDMVVDHHPSVKEIVCEFYAKLHKRRNNSFSTWVREKAIHVTLALISNITRAPQVHNPGYLWPINGIPTCAEMVEFFTDGQPHQKETERECSF
jgi:hypothetical protein